MNDTFVQPFPISETKQKMITIEENKIKNLENRFMGPSSNGKQPVECEPLKEAELETIKSKILFGEGHHSQNQQGDSNLSNKNASNKSVDNIQKKKSKDKSKKNYTDFLNNKRQRDYSIVNTNSPDYNNETLITDIFSSKNCSSTNYLFNQTNSSERKKNILDYYSKISANVENNSIRAKSPLQNSNENNKIKSKEYITILNELTQKNKLLEEKEKELEKIKQINSDNESAINRLNEYNKSLEYEVKRCRFDICNYIKENEEYKRKILKKSLIEKQYSIGKIGVQKTSHGQLLDYFEEGEEIKNIKKRLDEIKIEKEELDKQKKKLKVKKYSFLKAQEHNQNSNSQNQLLGSSPKSNSNLISVSEQDFEFQLFENISLINFKINNLIKEEYLLKEKQEKFDIEKVNFIHDYNLLNQESKCTFLVRKDSWPLLAGRYQTISLLGKGGYSEVYKAYDLENHIYVACKLHQLNPNWREEIKDNYIKHTIRENQIHKEINHPKIVKHYDTIEIDNNSFCTVLEYCTGPDLATYIKRNKNISEKEARIIISQILSGIEYLNKLPKKIIHYDLKPENIIFNNYEVKISDFGLAKIIDNNKDKIQLTSQGVGTYWYLPPECFRENYKIDIDAKVDIWSVGVILYEMIYRIKPFGQNYSQEQLIRDKIMYNANKVVFPAKPSISDECKEFIKGCLENRHEDRFNVFQALNSKFIRHDKQDKKEKGLSANLPSNKD